MSLLFAGFVHTLPCLGQRWGPGSSHPAPVQVQAWARWLGGSPVRGSAGAQSGQHGPASLLHPAPAAQEPPASGEPLFPLDCPRTTDMCCAVPAQRPPGDPPDRGVSQDQLLPVPLVTALLPLCPGARPGAATPCALSSSTRSRFPVAVAPG